MQWCGRVMRFRGCGNCSRNADDQFNHVALTPAYLCPSFKISMFQECREGYRVRSYVPCNEHHAMSGIAVLSLVNACLRIN